MHDKGKALMKHIPVHQKVKWRRKDEDEVLPAALPSASMFS